eukprot:2314464-Alexandrium_andersonii.AAC.1
MRNGRSYGRGLLSAPGRVKPDRPAPSTPFDCPCSGSTVAAETHAGAGFCGCLFCRTVRLLWT